ESSTQHFSVHFNGAPSLTAESANPLPLNGWHHAAFVADVTAQTVQVYIDGQPTGAAGSFGGSMLLSPPMKTLGIGVHTDDTGMVPAPLPGLWDGILDEVALWT